MDTTSLVMFLFVFALCVIFSSFTINYRRGEWAFLSMVLWFTLGTLHVGVVTTEIFYSLSFLYYGFGIIFMIYGLIMIFASFGAKKKEEEYKEGVIE